MTKGLNDLKWMVYIEDFNRRNIREFNVFNHYSLMEDLKKLIRKYPDYKDFCEQFEKDLRYYYWSKCEWETIWIRKDNQVEITSMFANDKWTPLVLDINDELAKSLEFFNLTKYGDEMKIDVYDQIMVNKDAFLEYVWNTIHPRKQINKKKGTQDE